MSVIRDALVEALCTDLKLVQVARQAEQARVQQHIDMIDGEMESKLAAARAEGAEESARMIAAVKDAGRLRQGWYDRRYLISHRERTVRRAQEL